ncbi:transglycosylase domain-containing protein [Corynebacterium lizhenjunii]|uniref:transglycosylase domain-containing protein n=1 Tax=Corynebacterium lizhenjunii TaxID=2709394 RepID=UPI0013EB53F5|nr:transglycosylase domain-containing protein [Corynebacterium lizhenjunii]
MGVTYLKALGQMFVATLLVGLLVALACAPAAGLGGLAVKATTQAMVSDVQNLEAGNVPGVTTIRDAEGGTLAYLYTQRRHPVAPEQISHTIKDAIVSIEDRRFYEHEGVDIQGNFRAVATNLLAGGVSQGASTINQQYVKNYLLLVDAETDSERQAATEQSVARKLREMRIATQIDKSLSKDEILSNYLNLIPFGNHAYGIEAAARTYFGIPAAQLNYAQAAMLAGMVQSSEYLNPYTNRDAVVERRNLVLQALVTNGHLAQEEADRLAGQDLGVLPRPATLPNGCITAGNRGFFCDFVLDYLASKGLDKEELSRGGYTVDTTLVPHIQDAAQAAVNGQTSPTAEGVAEVMSVLVPEKNDRDVVAMVSSRAYGLDQDNFETILPQPYSLVGNGAGSIFKLFTAAAAIDAGYGIQETVPVPARYEASGLGHGGAANCPPDKYCVENAGTYQPTMTLQDALAHSPNSTFVQLLEQVGVPAIVDMSVKLGLRSYTEDASFSENTSIAQAAKDANMGAYTLGPTAVNPLELSNVGATIAAEGMWCEPNPVNRVTDRDGNQVFIEPTPCERALNPEVAAALTAALSQDTTKGTAADSARAFGFGAPTAAKTGTSESNKSSAFLGFASGLAAAPYIYNDGTTNAPLCTAPVRQCVEGTLFGGMEPARTYFALASQVDQGVLPPYNPQYNKGTTGDALLDSVRGMSQSQATATLQSAGYTVTTRMVPGFGVGYGAVVRALKSPGPLRPGGEVVLQLSDGTGAPTPTTDPGAARPGANPSPGNSDPAPAAPRPAPSLEEQLGNLANEFRNAFGLNN